MAAVARARAFYGRERELAAFAGSTARVVFVHGIPGIGKSSLVERFLADEQALGSTVLALDCRGIEPTERGFLGAAATMLGVEPDLEAIAAALGERSSGSVVALDQYEVFRLMDTWLRATFVPALPDGARLFLAGREPPVAAWFSIPGGFESVPLGSLDEEASCALLEERGFGRDEAMRLHRLARGHPLALILASAGVSEHPELALEEAATTRLAGLCGRGAARQE